MALHMNLEEHNNNAPRTWLVRKHGRKWALTDKADNVMDTFETKTKAEEAKSSGFIFDLYLKEGQWFNGITPSGWKPYAVCKAEQLTQMPLTRR